MRALLLLAGLFVIVQAQLITDAPAVDETNYVVVERTENDQDYTAVDETTATPSRPLPRQGNFRIEIDFQHFENVGGIRHDGQYCDYFTNCDPSLKAVIDIDKPMLRFPGSATNANDFRVLAIKKDSNGFAVNNKVFRNVCSRSTFPSMVTARVEVHDFDTFSNNDLLEQFDCRFPFRPFRNGTDRGDGWSETLQCDAIHQPTKIKLSYRWRIIPISASQCRMSSAPVNVAAAVYNPNEATSGFTPPQDSQDFFGRVYGYIRSAMEFMGDLSKIAAVIGFVV